MLVRRTPGYASLCFSLCASASGERGGSGKLPGLVGVTAVPEQKARADSESLQGLQFLQFLLEIGQESVALGLGERIE